MRSVRALYTVKYERFVSLLVALSLAAACARTTSSVQAPADVPDVPDVQSSSPDVVTVRDAGVDVPRDVVRDAGHDPYTQGIGARCTTMNTSSNPADVDQGSCPDGQLCLPDSFGFHRGYCTQVCSDKPCPEGATCAGFGRDLAVCIATCDRMTPCRDRDGYECSARNGERVCLPSGTPVGLRDDMACFTTGDGGAHALPALAFGAFTEMDFAASQNNPDALLGSEGNVAINPVNGNALAAYIAIRMGAPAIGVSRVTAAGVLSAAESLQDPVSPLNSDPVLAYTRDGTAHAVWIGYNSDGTSPTQMHIRYARSTNDGERWSAVTSIDPAARCASGVCDKPWIIAGPPAGNDAGVVDDVLYAAYVTLRSSDDALWVQRSNDGGATWSPPVAVVRGRQLSTTPGAAVNLNHMAVEPNGTLHIVYAGTVGGGLGGAQVLVFHQRSLDGGVTWSAASAVSPRSPGALYSQPMVVVDGSRTHVAYVTSSPTGATNVMLATSDDGVIWTQRTLNDEPEACATHRMPALGLDPVTHLVHAIWVENRFGDGMIVHAVCPGEPSLPCAPNDRVTASAFQFTNSRDPQRWFGDYFGLAVDRDGRPWAAWTDTRTGSPAFYVSRGRAR